MKIDQTVYVQGNNGHIKGIIKAEIIGRHNELRYEVLLVTGNRIVVTERNIIIRK